jgi:hypothetical protein
MFHEGDAVEDLENSPMRDRTKYRPDASDLTFIVWAVIVSIGLILVSVAFGVGIDPDASMFASF